MRCLVLVVAVAVALAGCDTILAGDLDGAVAAPDAGTTDHAPVPDQAAVSDLPQPDPAGPIQAAAACIHPSVVARCSDGWCFIPAGCFTMGSPTTEPCRTSNEDRHNVTLTHSFEIQATEVTHGQFMSAMGYLQGFPYSPSPFLLGYDYPVETIYWHEAAAYCNALSTQAGLTPCYSCSGTGAAVTCSQASSYSGAQIYTCPGYRLPTEAEWEYAYRAGTQTAFYNGVIDHTACKCPNTDANANKIGWYCANAGNTQPVGRKKPNGWGLHDMAGNVWEWCDDRYQSSLGLSHTTDPRGATGSFHVIRGGYWGNDAASQRAARRSFLQGPSIHNHKIGFRCVRSIGDACGLFTITVKDWSWTSNGPKNYRISALLEVNGHEACYRFPGYHEVTKLTLSWKEGPSVEIHRTPAVLSIYGAGFGPTACAVGHCEVGDIFDTDEVYPGFPHNDLVKQYATLYGPPDHVCGHVYNADLVHRKHCAPLSAQ